MLRMFLIFLQIGLISFGGGYAMIPVIQRYVVDMYGWMTPQAYADAVAVAAMAPGPVAANSATLVGWSMYGWRGALLACLAVTLPCLLIIIALGMVLRRNQQHWLVRGIFDTLRPVVVGVVAFSAISFTQSSGALASLSPGSIATCAIALLSLLGLRKTAMHPLLLMAGAAGIGAVVSLIWP